MAVIPNLNPVTSGYNLSKINDNFQKIEQAFQEVLGRGGDLPNHMESDLDMNGNDLLNIGLLSVDDITVDGESVLGVLERAEEAADEAQAASATAVASAATASAAAAAAASIVSGFSAFWLNVVGATNAAASWLLLNIVGYLTTRSAVKALTPSVGMAVDLEGVGKFVWTLGDYTARIAADTVGGMFLKANSVSAATGAWVLQLDNLSREVNIAHFNPAGDGSTDDSAVIQCAFNVADVLGWGIYFPAPLVSYKISTTVNTTQCKIRADKNTKIISGLNSAIINIDVPITGIYRPYITGVSFENTIVNGGAYSSSGAIQISGPGTAITLGQYLFEHGIFRDLSFKGFFRSIKISIGWYVTAFGKESVAAWNIWDNIEFEDGNNDLILGWDLIYGSGTGNQFRNIHGVPSAVAYISSGVAGTGFVTGDLIIEGHFGGLAGTTSVLSVATGCVYNSKIKISGQIDAGCEYPIVFAASQGTHPSNIDTSNLSHSADVYTGAPTTGIWVSTIKGILVDKLELGNLKTSSSTGLQTVYHFQVELDQFQSCMFEVFAGGLSEGEATIAKKVSGTLHRDSTTITATQDASPIGPAGVIVFTQVGNTMQIGVTITPTTIGSVTEMQLFLRGGRKRAKIL